MKKAEYEKGVHQIKMALRRSQKNKEEQYVDGEKVFFVNSKIDGDDIVILWNILSDNIVCIADFKNNNLLFRANSIYIDAMRGTSWNVVPHKRLASYRSKVSLTLRRRAANTYVSKYLINKFMKTVDNGGHYFTINMNKYNAEWLKVVRNIQSTPYKNKIITSYLGNGALLYLGIDIGEDTLAQFARKEASEKYPYHIKKGF